MHHLPVATTNRKNLLEHLAAGELIHSPMDTLHWPLSVLTRSIAYKNLTGASAHVGLSQPQLSRLISQLEKEFSVTLLDRSARRKAAWTPAAYRLAEVYSQNSRRLESALREALEEQFPPHIHMGTLEGLGTLALKAAHAILDHSKAKTVQLDVIDQDDLDAKFLNGDFDIILTARMPGRAKLRHFLELGVQTLETVESSKQFCVMSPFEYGQQKRKSGTKTFISNSLALRKLWFDEFGGYGVVPSTVQKSVESDPIPVLVISPDSLNESVWKVVKESLVEPG